MLSNARVEDLARIVADLGLKRANINGKAIVKQFGKMIPKDDWA